MCDAALEFSHLRCRIWAFRSCRIREGKGQVDESGLIPQMLRDTKMRGMFDVRVQLHQAATPPGPYYL